VRCSRQERDKILLPTNPTSSIVSSVTFLGLVGLIAVRQQSKPRQPELRLNSLAKYLRELFRRRLGLSVIGHQPVYLLLDVGELSITVSRNGRIAPQRFDQSGQSLKHRLFRRLDSRIAPLIRCLLGSDAIRDSSELGHQQRRSIVLLAKREHFLVVARYASRLR